jgi:hypothetical protein
MKLLLSFVALALSECTAWTSACYTTSQRSNAQCLSIVSAVFIDLHAPAPNEFGGALKADVSSTIDISGCSFIRCTAYPTIDTGGGACFLESGARIAITETCGNACSAANGQFAWISSTEKTGHFLNLTGMLDCGECDGVDRDDGLLLENMVAEVESVNFTKCALNWSGSAIGLDPGEINGIYLTVVGCSGVVIFMVWESLGQSTIGSSNFVNNSLMMQDEEYYSLIFSASEGLIVSQCIFQGTTPTGMEFYRRSGDKYDVADCVFSSTPGYSGHFTESSYLVTVTSSHNLRANDLQLCSAPPCATASSTPYTTLSPIASSSPTRNCEVQENGCFATGFAIPSNWWCCVFRDVHFVDLHGSSRWKHGGAICGEKFDSAELDGCIFLRCSVVNMSENTYGGAVYLTLLTGTVSITACCANECLARYVQSFYISSSLTTGHTVNSSVVVACGTSAPSGFVPSAGLRLNQIDAGLTSLNFTSDYGTLSAAVSNFGTKATFEASFLTVLNCSGETIIHHNDGPLIPTIEYSNFYSNLVVPHPQGTTSVLYANNYSMTVRYCIFKDNEARDLAIGKRVVKKFIVENCVFSGSFPQSSYVDLGTGNVETSTTASFPLPFEDVAVCFASPCRTISSTPLATLSLSPTPNCEIREHLCFATRFAIPSNWRCCVFRTVHFVDLHGSSGSRYGGALYCWGRDGVELDDCTFLDCSIIGESAAAFGGAVFLYELTGTVSISGCCACECVANHAQSFYLDSSSTSCHTINASIFVLCGTGPLSSVVADGGLDLIRMDALLTNLNFTRDYATFATAMACLHTPKMFAASYVTISNCTGSTIVHKNEGPWLMTIEFSNFYWNAVLQGTGGNAVLFGNNYSMTVRYCIFNDNNGSDIRIGGTIIDKFVVENCVFSAAFPNSAYVSFGEGNTETSTTASFPLPFEDIAVCFASPCPTISTAPLASLTSRLSVSLSFLASDIPGPSTESRQPSSLMVSGRAPGSDESGNSHYLSRSGSLIRSHAFRDSGPSSISTELGYSGSDRLSVDLSESPIVMFSQATARSGLGRHSMDHSESWILLLSDAFGRSDLTKHSMDHSESGIVLLSDALARSDLTKHSMDHSESAIVLLSDALARSELAQHSGDHSESVALSFSGEFADSGHADISGNWISGRFHGSLALVGHSGRAWGSWGFRESSDLLFSEEFCDSDAAMDSRDCLSGGVPGSSPRVGSRGSIISWDILPSGPFCSLFHTISSGPLGFTADFPLSDRYSPTAPPPRLPSPSPSAADSIPTDSSPTDSSAASQTSTATIAGSSVAALLLTSGSIVFLILRRRAALAGLVESADELEEPGDEIPTDTASAIEVTFESQGRFRRLTQANLLE